MATIMTTIMAATMTTLITIAQTTRAVSEPMSDAHTSVGLKSNQQGLWASMGALLASAGTLVCCVLPAAMVSLGAGASLVSLLGAFPQLIWLSAHKGWVFGVAVVMLGVAGVLLHRARFAPCPIDPKLAVSCQRLRRWSVITYVVAIVATVTGGLFAFLLPIWMN